MVSKNAYEMNGAIDQGRAELKNRLLRSTAWPGHRLDTGQGTTYELLDDGGDMWMVEHPSAAYSVTEIAATATRVWELTGERLIGLED